MTNRHQCTRTLQVAVALVALGVAGCAQNAVYWPAIVNAPTLAKRGDVDVSVHGSPIQMQANGAVAVTDHIAVRAEGDYRFSFTGAGEHNNSAAVGLGWFWNRSAAGASDEGWHGSVNVDYGIGEVKNVLTDLSLFDPCPTPDEPENCSDLPAAAYGINRYRTSFRRVSVQADSGYDFSGFSINGVLRISSVDGTLTYHYEDTAPNGQPPGTGEEAIDWILFEPAMVMRADIAGPFQLEVQLGSSQPVGRVGRVAEEGVLWPFIAAIGLNVDF